MWLLVKFDPNRAPEKFLFSTAQDCSIFLNRVGHNGVTFQVEFIPVFTNEMIQPKESDAEQSNFPRPLTSSQLKQRKGDL